MVPASRWCRKITHADYERLYRLPYQRTGESSHGGASGGGRQRKLCRLPRRESGILRGESAPEIDAEEKSFRKLLDGPKPVLAKDILTPPLPHSSPDEAIDGSTGSPCTA